MASPIALVGSGEFTAAMEDVDAALLAGRPPRAVFLPTAAALEGADRVAYWVDLGLAHYRRLGVDATPLVVLDRTDADSPALADRVAGAGLVYLSGGDPTYLASTLVGSRVGAAIQEAWSTGSAVAGCSAGAIALMEWVPDIRGRRSHPVPGLGLVHGLTVLPHFDQLERWAPGAVRWALDGAGPGAHVVGVDEDTAMVGGDGAPWRVMGSGAAWVLRAEDDRTRYGAGETLSLG